MGREQMKLDRKLGALLATIYTHMLICFNSRIFAVGLFAVGRFAVRTLRYKDISP